MSTITRDEWVARCAARLIERGVTEDLHPHSIADACLETLDEDLTESPEEAADEELSYWTD
jgi:hypothetical protein